MRKIFDLELENLYHRIEKMGEMVNDAIDRAVTSLSTTTVNWHKM